MAVVAAVELDDLVASGEPARQPDAGHGCFRAAVHHPHLFDRRHRVANQCRQLDFELIGNAETDPARGRVAHGVDHDFRRVTENGWTPAADIIDVIVSVDIPDSRAFRAHDEERFAPDIAKRADRRVDAARDALLCTGEQFGRMETQESKRRTPNAERPTPN